jgi:hypothetical protein
MNLNCRGLNGPRPGVAQGLGLGLVIQIMFAFQLGLGLFQVIAIKHYIMLFGPFFFFKAK